MTRSTRRVAVALALGVVLAAPASAPGHGDEPEPGEAAEVQALARQPARVLAQQAHALLHIREDAHEAGVRLDAALKSRDQGQVDVAILRRAAETLDGGDPGQAQEQIDEALSRPLGASSGRLFHGAGREFRPATGAQEIVAIAGGALLLAAFALAALRRRASTDAAAR